MWAVHVAVCSVAETIMVSSEKVLMLAGSLSEHSAASVIFVTDLV